MINEKGSKVAERDTTVVTSNVAPRVAKVEFVSDSVEILENKINKYRGMPKEEFYRNELRLELAKESDDVGVLVEAHEDRVAEEKVNSRDHKLGRLGKFNSNRLDNRSDVYQSDHRLDSDKVDVTGKVKHVTA